MKRVILSFIASMAIVTMVSASETTEDIKPNHPQTDKEVNVQPNYPSARYDNIQVNQPMAQTSDSMSKPNHPSL